LKEEALRRTQWRSRFERAYGTVVGELMNEWTCCIFHYTCQWRSSCSSVMQQ